MTTPIKFRAGDDEDLKVVSACLQDAIVPIGEMCYQAQDRRFVVVLNRFKWETAAATTAPTQTNQALFPFQRTHTAVRFENVTGVRTRGLDLRNRALILELLSLEKVAEGVVLHFSGGACIRVESRDWLIIVEDVGESWPTACQPCHPLDVASQSAA